MLEDQKVLKQLAYLYEYSTELYETYTEYYANSDLEKKMTGIFLSKPRTTTNIYISFVEYCL